MKAIQIKDLQIGDIFTYSLQLHNREAFIVINEDVRKNGSEYFICESRLNNRTVKVDKSNK